MIKLIDLDNAFDKYISDYVYSNIGKIKPEEIEDNMPVLYGKFGDEKLDALDGFTPNTFYKQFGVLELLECLKGHLENKVPVSDFLCEAITCNKENSTEIIRELDRENSEEFIMYLMNMLEDLGCAVPASKYLEFVLYDYSENLRELATELLYNSADEIKEEILQAYKTCSDAVKACLVDILSHASKDDRVFDILILEFTKNQNQLALYSAYLAKYGDERALPFLMQAIEQEKISYADFEELRFAIEALGGEYNKVRDFSSDKSFKKIKQTKSNKIS